VAEDADAESLEDDSFENVTYWGSEVSDDVDEPAEEQVDETEPEQADTYVFAEDESQAADTPAEADVTEEAGEQPVEDAGEAVAHEVVADSSEDQVVDDEHATSEPELVETDADVDASEVTEVYGSDDEQVVVDEADPFADESSVDAESEPEPVTEPTLDDWQGADDAEDYEIDSAGDEVVAAPVPLKKRNGGGSRGKKVVGLKVGASQIAAAVVAGNGENQALVDVARRPLEEGVVVGGELRDHESLVRSLKAFFKESGLPTKNVRLGLSSSRVGVRTFDIAGVEDEERFDNAVRFKAHEVLPVAAHESVLDYRVVEERYTESGEVSRRVLLVVAPRDQVEPYIEACREAGIRLAGIDLESFGLLRTFVPPFGARSRTEDSATVVVAIGHESSTLLVAGGGICEFTRVFDWGGGALQNAIADELDVPHMEAATILTHLSLSGPGRHLESLDADTRSRALEAVRTRLTPFARELVSSLQFYQTQPESLGIREIVITGGTAHLEGLAEALNQMIGVSVSVGDPLARVDVQVDIPPALDATIGSLAVPIGLAIEDEPGRSVNLLPKEARQTTKPPRLLAVAAPLAAAIPLVAVAFLFMQASGTVGDRQAELDVITAQIDALPEPTKPTIDPALAADQAARATAVAQILGTRLTWERVLGDVSRVLPSGVSLTELTATAAQPSTPEPVPTTTDASSTTTTSSTPAPPPPPPPSATTTATGVTVTGYALNYADIARTLARLQAVPSLTGAELESATPTKIGKKRVIQFTIVAALATPGGVQ
jgi:type IV pilus assembly protein PilM